MDESPSEEDLAPVHILEIIGNAIVGGMESYVYNLIQRLPSYGFKVTCLAPYESAYTTSLRRLGSDVFVTHMDVNPSWRSIQFTSELILHNKIDLIHAHLPRAHVLAGITGKLTRRPAAVTVHGMDISTEDLGISRTTETHMIVVCQQAYAQALALGMTPERLSLVPNGVDLKIYRTGKGGASFREEHGIPAGVPLVGFVGRLAHEKGPDQFIQLVRYIHTHRPQVRFIMVGEGPKQDEIQEMIQEEDLSGVVHVAGVASNTVEVYQAIDVLAQTSRVEGMPFVLLEAMACGVPVAAMSVGGVGEIVEVGSSGITSAPGDWMGLGNGIIAALDNPVSLKRMGIAARKRAEENFDISESLIKLAQLFRGLSGRSPVSPDVLHAAWSVNPPNSPEYQNKPPITSSKKGLNA